MTTQAHILFYIFLFIILNQINTYFLTKEKINRYITPCRQTLLGEVTSLLGNMTMLFILLFIGLLVCKSYQGLFLYLTIISFILNIFCLALSVYSRYFGTAFSKEGLEMFKNPARSILSGVPLEMMKEFIFYYRIILLLPSVTLLTYFVFLNKNATVVATIQLSPYIGGGVLLILVALLYIQKRFFNHLFLQGLAIESVKSTYAIQNLGLYPFYLSPFSIFNYRRKMKKLFNYQVPEELIPQIALFNKNKTTYNNILDGKTYHNRLLAKDVPKTIQIDDSLSKKDSLHGILKDKKLVLVQVESLNHFILTLSQLQKERPFLDGFLKECLVFNNFYTCAGIAPSSDAEIATQTGLYPSGKNILFWHNFDRKKGVYKQEVIFASLAKYFKQQDYYTQAIHGDEGAFYNRKNAYPQILGFDQFFALEDFKDKIIARKTATMNFYASDYLDRKHTSPWISDYALAKQTAQVIHQKQKQFLFPITMMPHTPFEFNPEPNRFVIENSADLQAITQRYLNFTYYYDRFIRRFFLDEEGKNITDQNTVYLFYGDHGCGIKNGDLSRLFRQPLTKEQERKHLLQIGCFLYVPGKTLNQEGVYEGLIKGQQPLVRGQIDIYRSIIELFDLPCQQDFYMGVHLLSQEPTFVVDNRVLDIVLDKGLFSMRNPRNKTPKNLVVDDALYQHIRHLKLLNDIVYKEPYLQFELNKYLEKQNQETKE